MIILLSRQEDGSTRDVAEWLTSMGKQFVRLNADDRRNKFNDLDLTKNEFTIKVNGKQYKFLKDNIKSIWHRRSGFASNGIKNVIPEKTFPWKENFAQRHLKRETDNLFDYLYYVLESSENIRHIGSSLNNSVNKLTVSETAKVCGLLIPDTFIISTKKKLKALFRKEKKLITKAIGNGVYEFTESYGYYTYTEKITQDFIEALPETFFPSLVQKELDKKLELRIFYLKEEFYSMAIFSQESSTTKVDSRKGFAADFMPRRVPYKLPETIKKHLTVLMKKLKLNTGSIDMVVTEKNEYYFLEVNPIGQFGMTSQPCNYYLEKKVAKSL